MKKVLLLSAFSALLLGSALFFACQKEKVVSVAQTTTSVDQDAASDDRLPCSTVRVSRGIGLAVCGTTLGSYGCIACGQTLNSQPVTALTQTFALSGSGVFGLTNTTGSSITAAISFNCANIAPLWVTLAPYASASFTVQVDAQGCCFASPCY
jgi:hypothetical protein